MSSVGSESFVPVCVINREEDIDDHIVAHIYLPPLFPSLLSLPLLPLILTFSYSPPSPLFPLCLPFHLLPPALSPFTSLYSLLTCTRDSRQQGSPSLSQPSWISLTNRYTSLHYSSHISLHARTHAHTHARTRTHTYMHLTPNELYGGWFVLQEHACRMNSLDAKISFKCGP